MSLQKWLEYGWLRSHQSSRKEISDLLRIIDRDLQNAIATQNFSSGIDEQLNLEWLNRSVKSGPTHATGDLHENTC